MQPCRLQGKHQLAGVERGLIDTQGPGYMLPRPRAGGIQQHIVIKLDARPGTDFEHQTLSKIFRVQGVAAVIGHLDRRQSRSGGRHDIQPLHQGLDTGHAIAHLGKTALDKPDIACVQHKEQDFSRNLDSLDLLPWCVGRVFVEPALPGQYDLVTDGHASIGHNGQGE
jgi:hypothetical protein